MKKRKTIILLFTAIVVTVASVGAFLYFKARSDIFEVAEGWYGEKQGKMSIVSCQGMSLLHSKLVGAGWVQRQVFCLVSFTFEVRNKGSVRSIEWVLTKNGVFFSSGF